MSVQTNLEIIQEFQNATRAEYGTSGFSSGYLGGLLGEVLECVPKAQRHVFLQSLKLEAERSRAEVATRELSPSL